MTGAGHTSVQQRKKVLVVMRDGNHFVAKFKEKKGRFIHFYDHDSIDTTELRTLTLYRNQERQ